jgi:hypothetical protein
MVGKQGIGMNPPAGPLAQLAHAMDEQIVVELVLNPIYSSTS